MEESVWFILTLGRLPGWFRSFIAFLIENVLHDPVTASTMRLVGDKPAAQTHKWIIRRDQFREEFNDWYISQQFDALIAPTSAVPATKFNATKMVSALATSTLLYNVLNWPVGVVPVTKVKKDEFMDDARWKGKDREGYSWLFLDQLYGRNVYKDIAEGGVGLPKET